jgi:hypothetical protein
MPMQGRMLDAKRTQEALRRRYAYRASVTPLEDGSFAVFAIDFSAESLVIANTVEELGLAVTSRANLRRRSDRNDFEEVDFTQA